ncbi:SHOCT domain-containing protein [Streptomyces achromogenes]|uniref:SHOCT domain-containing protein n=1 Tax=Streptomyces achromogenes TaxID=67255 RepID=UPI0036B5AA83
MFWYGRGVGGWGLFAMTMSMVVFWALIITFGVLLYRSLVRPGRDSGGFGARPPDASPEQLLAERFARGEIDEDEYRRRLSVLRDDRGGGPGAGPRRAG